MARQSKRTSAPAPMEISPPVAHAVPSPRAQPVPPPGIPSMFGPGAWCPPQSVVPSSAPYWIAGQQHPSMAGPSAPGAWWAPAPVCASANTDDSDLQAWGADSHPPGGFVNFLKKNTPSCAQPLSNGSLSQPINVGDDTNNGDCARTEKRLLWTKEEDLRLVSAWLNNSNDPIQANYKKNDQYWKGVAAVFNSTTPKNRARLAKQVKDHFGRIKKRVAWFCGSWKEANAMWASGESDVDLMERALASYEEDHKSDGPFMFKHCWEVLRKEPKWDAYLERLEEIEPEKRKFNIEEDVAQQFSLDEASDERPVGGKKAKEHLKRKRKDQTCIIDLEDELMKFVDAQNTANEGRKDMLETQRRVSTEKLEARKLAYLAAKENKESAMLETYRSLMMQDTTVMPEDVRSEHLLALRCFREKIFGIYPEWAAFMKTISLPQTEKHKLFAEYQEGARKDVERAFGVLQSRFTIVRRPARLWKRKSVGRIMMACVILHNMIVEDEKEEARIHIDLNENPGSSLALPPEVNVGGNLCFADVMRRKAALHARPQHTQLKTDLVEHIWNRFGNRRHN